MDVPHFMRIYRRRRDVRRIEKQQAELARLRWRVKDMERDMFEARAESLGEHIWAVGLNQMDLRIKELEAQVTRLQRAYMAEISNAGACSTSEVIEYSLEYSDLDPIGDDDDR